MSVLSLSLFFHSRFRYFKIRIYVSHSVLMSFYALLPCILSLPPRNCPPLIINPSRGKMNPSTMEKIKKKHSCFCFIFFFAVEYYPFAFWSSITHFRCWFLPSTCCTCPLFVFFVFCFRFVLHVLVYRCDFVFFLCFRS